MKSIPYGKQSVTKEDIKAVVEVLRSEFLTQGPKIKKFEDTFANYIGSKFAVAVANGTAALHLSALALNVKSETKVITTPITFSSSANCIRFCGGEVYFSDINRETYTLDIQKVRDLLEMHPKGTFSGIIPVDFAGYPTNLEEFRKLADEFGIWIIEDASHAPGGYFIDSNGEKQYCGNGKYADLAIFSFHPVKHITTGEGGMVTTNNKALYEKLILLRTHGITKDPKLLNENHGPWYYEMIELGYNYRLSDLQAALGISQLKRAKQGIKKRQGIALKYNEAFKNTDIVIPPSKHFHAYHLYVIQVEKRKELYDYLRKNNIFTQVHYIPVHLHLYYRKLGWKIGDMPIAEKYYKYCLSLPMYPSLSSKDQKYVIDKIIEFISK